MNSQYQECYFELKTGLKLYYRHYNANALSAPIIVCLHGVTRNSKDFEAIATNLSQKYQVIVPDIRGRGKSDYDTNWHNYQPAVYAQDTWDLVQHLNLETFALIGTSMGGLVAMIMAAQQPHRLAAVVLNDIGPEISQLGLDRIFGCMSKAQQDQTLDDVINSLRNANSAFFPDLDDDGWLNQALSSYKLLETGFYDVDYDSDGVVKALSEASLPGDPWEMFNCMNKLPVLLLHGELSDLLTVDIIQKMRSSKSDLQVATIPRVGHAPLLDEPESIQAINKFILTLQV